MPTVDPLVFIHVPKTGGRSVVEYLRARTELVWPGKPARYPSGAFQTIEQTLHWYESLGSGVEAVAGHFPAGLSDFVRCREVVVLREPISRLVSYHGHLSRAATPQPGYSPNKLTWLRGAKAAGNPMVCETQTRILAGYGPLNRTTLTAKDRERALDRLKKLYFVGVTERLDEFCSGLAKRLGWEHGNVSSIGAATKKKMPQNEEVLRAARACAGNDLLLYEEAVS